MAAIIVAVVTYVVFEVSEDLLVQGAPLTSGPLVGAIVSFIGNVTATVQSLGYWGIFLLMVLESSSLPIPSEVVLPFAGFMVSIGQLNFWFTVAVATVAGIVGSLIDYYIGLKGSKFLIQKRILGRVLLSESQLNVAAGWFNKYGAITVFVSRLIPGFRTLVSFPAGASKMPLAKFVIFTTAGCLIWNAVLIYFGDFLGSNWKEVAGVSHYLIIGSVGVFVAAAVVYLLWRKRRTARSKFQSATT